MFSLIVNAKKWLVLTKSTTKIEALTLISCTATQKHFTSKSMLLSASICKNFNLKARNCRSLSNPPKDFGKIVELDVEFDEVKLDDETIKYVRRQKKKIEKSNYKVDVSPEIEELNENLQNETELHESVKKAASGLNCELAENSILLSSKMSELKSRKNREKKQEIILEGKRLIHDAISVGFKPLKIFLSKRSLLEKLNLPENIKVVLMPYRSLKLWSDVVTPQGIIGIFKMPNLKTLENKSYSLPLTVICDNMRDPGNLGSVLRIVAGAGCSKLILTKGCVDIWEPKVLRASAGAHFHIPITNDIPWSDIENEINTESKVILADMSNYSTQNEDMESKFKTSSEISDSLPMQIYYSVNYSNSENTVLVVGGETHGISEEAYKFAIKRKGTKAFIPLSNGIESLNNSVALGIFIYEFKRQLDCTVSKEPHSTLPVSDNS